MKRIITAIGNPDLNNKLREVHKYEVVSKDIQYKEGIIEILNEDSEIDVLILKTSIPGEKDIKEFITDLTVLNNKLEVIVFIEEDDEEIIRFLNSRGIFKVYVNLKINIKEVIESIDGIEINKTKEIASEIGELKELIKNETNIKNALERRMARVLLVTGAPGIRKKCFFHNFSKISGKKR